MFNDLMDSNGNPIKVKPKKGQVDPSKKDFRTSHEALRPRKGVKYGANMWLHMYRLTFGFLFLPFPFPFPARFEHLLLLFLRSGSIGHGMHFSGREASSTFILHPSLSFSKIKKDAKWTFSVQRGRKRASF